MANDKTLVAKQLDRLFSAFPTAARADEVLAAKTYLEALDGYSIEAIEKSVQQFIRGLVPTHDGRFAPSAAELARNVKQWHDAIQLRDDAKNVPQLASGILSVDFGYGKIDMTKLTLEQQDHVLRTGQAPLIEVGGVTPRLQRMNAPKIITGDRDGDKEVA